MRLWLCSQHHFVVSESIELKNKNKNNLKKIKQFCSVVLTRCRCNRSLSTVFPLQVAFRILSELLSWRTCVPGLTKITFPLGLSCLPTKQRLKQSIWNAALWSYSCCLGISTWRTTSSAGPRCRIAEQIQPVPPTAPPRLSQQTLYLSHFLP